VTHAGSDAFVDFNTLLHEHARRRRDRVAIESPDQDARITFGELDDLTRRVVHFLAAHGVGHGDRISILASVNTQLFGSSPAVQSVRTVFRDLMVIRVGPVGGGQANAPVSTSLTVIMTACDAEVMDWLLNNAVLKYELESYKDYGSIPTGPDPGCGSVGSAKGVGPVEVNKRWSFTTP